MNNQTVNDYFKHHWAKLIVFVLFTAVVSFFAPLKSFQLKWLIDSRASRRRWAIWGWCSSSPSPAGFRTAEPPLLYKTRLRCRGAGTGTGHGAGAAPPGVPISAGGRRSLSLLLTTDLRTLYDDYYMSIFNIVFWGGIMLCALGMYLYISPVMLAAILLVTVPPLVLPRR